MKGQPTWGKQREPRKACTIRPAKWLAEQAESASSEDTIDYQEETPGAKSSTAKEEWELLQDTLMEVSAGQIEAVQQAWRRRRLLLRMG